MENQAEQPAGSALCPTCGSPIDSHAAFCAACGAALVLEAAPTPPAEAAAEIAAGGDMPPAPPAAETESRMAEVTEPTPVVTPAPEAMGQRRCDWCGALNPRGVERCQTCHAMFPRPEQDDAIRRAGEARIQAVEEEIALRQRMRKRRGLRRIFG